MRTRLALALVPLLALPLAGCGGGSGSNASSTSAQTSSGPKLGDETFGSVLELRDALTKQGFSCPSWNQTNVMTSAAESGSCDDSTVLATYASEQSKQDGMDGYKSVQAEASSLASDDPSIASEEGDHGVIYGKNWSLNTGNVTAWQKKLGGVIVR